jgi:hypothetical protein
MLIGSMRVPSSDERQVVDVQHNAWLAAGVDELHLHQDKQSEGRSDRAGLKICLTLVHWRCAGGLDTRPPRPLARLSCSHSAGSCMTGRGRYRAWGVL